MRLINLEKIWLKTSLFSLIFFSLSKISAQQPATITFSSNEKMDVKIYQPIDNHFNRYDVSKQIFILPNASNTQKTSASYECPISDGFAFLYCEFSNGFRYVFPLESGQSLSVFYFDNKLKIEGDNADGIVFYNNEYIDKGLISYLMEFQNMLSKNVQYGLDIESINNDIQKIENFAYRDTINKLKTEGRISALFADIINTDLHYAFNSIAYDAYHGLKNGHTANYKPNAADLIEIQKQVEKLFLDSNPLDAKTLKYNYASRSSYYYHSVYEQMNQKEQEELLQATGESKNTFGPYISFLSAPDYIQKPLLGANLVFLFQYHTGEADTDKLFRYFEKKYPDSEYIPVIQKYINKEQKTREENLNESNVLFIDQPVQSLVELTEIEGLKGKNIYIDLWATWCVPCKMEFQHNQELHALLIQYPSIVPVYLSIDDDKLDALWKNDVQKFSLEGYNMRASQSLKEDIMAKIYDKGILSIPRYVLLNMQGQVIASSLPRPSEIKKLKIAFDKIIIKQK
jgi:thiol-disulfide isomerase/thioredoxin